MEKAITLKKLRKVFRSGAVRISSVLALEGLDLEVRGGEVFGLLGPNGSGKSTTIKICLDLVRPTSGECLVFGGKASQPKSRQRIGYVPEAPFFYGYLTGESLVQSMGRFSGLSGSDLRKRTGDVLETVGLLGAEKRPIRTYSKGMMQRLGLAQALVHDPDLVILDEPTAGVDPIGARQITEMIRLLKSQGKTVLLCSHLLSQVESVCDRVAILHRGRMLAEGTLDDLLHSTGSKPSLLFENRKDLAKGREVATAAGLQVEEGAATAHSLEEVFVNLVRENEKENAA
ncbi:ABC transporter ATP-binding protein [Puniceicoccus vermicola]|uniref:ABC transporter ATP-binding protein n=1 Tax=Puniceicoccus vermicola TaxID=388746 RepID=A0A7X1AX87_9BACT|nr:ABC transporter ATP-binding protein [Puniceicoccus vermicola]MBC2601651.1 ABC transporter ATP-binding protein [Puniceicoccus vermicola]